MKNVIFLISFWLFAQMVSSSPFAGGIGTAEDPYQITTAEQLDSVRNYLNDENVCFLLMNNIDLGPYIDENYSVAGWLPVGSVADTEQFRGQFDGNGKAISGLWINNSKNHHMGLFGYMGGENSVIKNLTVTTHNEKGGIRSTKNAVGILVGSCGEIEKASGRIENCIVSGKVSGASSVGGLAGQGTACIQGCIVKDVEVTATSGTGVGGFIGHVREFLGGTPVIKDCMLLNAKVMAFTSYAGGFVGEITGPTIEINNCHAHNIVIEPIAGRTPNSVGGFVGDNKGRIFNSSFIGSVKGNHNVGGFVGHLRNRIENCFAVANVVGTGIQIGGFAGTLNEKGVGNGCISHSFFCGTVEGTNIVGGLIGRYEKSVDPTEIASCYVHADIMATGDQVGGFIGDAYEGAESIRKSYFTGSITASGTDVGAFIGKDQGFKGLENTYCLNIPGLNVVGNNTSVDGLILLSESEMKKSNSYGSFDFSSAWDIVEDNSFPYFKTQSAPFAATKVTLTEMEGKIQGTIESVEVRKNHALLSVSGEVIEDSWKGTFQPQDIEAGDQLRIQIKEAGKLLSYPVSVVVEGDTEEGQEIEMKSSAPIYTQDFNSLPAGSATETSGEWADGKTLEGWYLYSMGKNAPSIPADLKYINVNPTWETDSTATGGSNGFTSIGYNFEIDRSLGAFISNAVGHAYFAVKIRNADDEGKAIESLKITYTGEQWSSSNTFVQDLVFSYKISAASIADSEGWIDVDDLKFTSPVINTIGGITKYINGNVPNNRIEGLSATISVDVPFGEVIWLRWYDQNDNATDHILTIDDLKIEAIFDNNSSLSEINANDGITIRHLSNEKVLVGSTEELKTIEVYNSLGQIATIVQKINNTEKELELNGLTSGIYFIKVTTVDNRVQVLKIMKR